MNGHAYAIVKVREFTMSSEDGSSVTFRMLLLKNPWAFNPWDLPGVNVRHLDWSPLSTLWSKPGGTYMAQQLYGAVSFLYFLLWYAATHVHATAQQT